MSNSTAAFGLPILPLKPPQNQMFIYYLEFVYVLSSKHVPIDLCPRLSLKHALDTSVFPLPMKVALMVLHICLNILIHDPSFVFAE